MGKVPILLLIFNRPDLTEKIFSQIRKYRPTRLYIAADGPRESKPEEERLCNSARKIIEKVDWDCKVETLFRESHLGCKASVSGAISWLFENEETGIILEDDTLPVESFFPYCEEMLYRYRDHHEISMISGVKLGKLTIRDSYFFSDYTHVWGWAGWRRSWKDYDVAISSFPVKRTTLFNRKKFSKFEKIYWDDIFTNTYEGKINTWDYQWVYCNFINNRYSIMPNVNLISNIGFREDATHTHSSEHLYANMETGNLNFPLIHPENIKVHTQMDKLFRISFLPAPVSKVNIKRRIVRNIRRVMGSVRNRLQTLAAKRS